MVQTRAWERLGFARLADYARERTGLSARQLQDLAHVDARLMELPAVERALAAGAISWTRAHLVARVATREDEVRWLAFARRVPTRGLEREVRAVDRGSIEGGGLESDDDGRPSYPRVGVIVRCTPRVQAQFHRTRWIARRVAGEALPPWACMEAVAAEALAALGLGKGDQEGEGDPGDDSGADPAGGASWADRTDAIEAADACAEASVGAGASEDVTWALADACADRERETANACAGQGREPAVPREGGAASQAAANACAAQGFASEPEGTDRDVARVPANACAAQAPPTLHSLLDGLDAADAFELDARLRRAVALEQRLEAEAAPLLRRAAAAKLHRRHGFPTFERWARERLGLAPRKAHALVRLARASEACPALHAAFSQARLSWVQAHALIPLLLLPDAEPFRAAWVARAEQLSVRRLEEDVDAALRLAETDREAFASSGGLPERSDPGLGLQTRARARDAEGTSSGDGETGEGETARFLFTAPRDVARLFRAVLCSARRHLERARGRPASEGEAAGWMFEHAFESWGANDRRVARAHRVFERDGWRCTVPGCTSYRNLHDHHVVFRSAGGSDALANRTTLCAWHHLRGVHAGRVRCAGSAPNALRFELGIRAGRRSLLVYGPGERVSGPRRPA